MEKSFPVVTRPCGYFLPSFALHFNESLKLIGLTPSLLEPFVSLRRADLADFFTRFTIAKLNRSNRMENVPTPLNNGYFCVCVCVCV